MFCWGRRASETSDRHPERARLRLNTADGAPLTVEVDTLTPVSMHIGLGYGDDTDWPHGRWMGRDYSTSSCGLTDPGHR